ncbi:hypothetical protein [Neptunomonas sp. XY-337]|uniref:hypothetical protein n=1 Tax=Neptunomonas sp. XY-337 TaxID=2561897 RepID=UPI0010A9B06D|nr:hypothetical protein [Neptunomonas sp. XY-337]
MKFKPLSPTPNATWFWLMLGLMLWQPSLQAAPKQDWHHQATIRYAAEDNQIFVDPESAAKLKRYHNQYLREPMYEDYLYVVLLTLLGEQEFQGLFKNLGGGFVPIQVREPFLIMKGTRDHCGGLQEGLIMVDTTTGHVFTARYAVDQFYIATTTDAATPLPSYLERWVLRILNANGPREKPSRNKVLLQKMAGDWCL